MPIRMAFCNGFDIRDAFGRNRRERNSESVFFQLVPNIQLSFRDSRHTGYEYTVRLKSNQRDVYHAFDRHRLVMATIQSQSTPGGGNLGLSKPDP